MLMYFFPLRNTLQFIFSGILHLPDTNTANTTCTFIKVDQAEIRYCYAKQNKIEHFHYETHNMYLDLKEWDEIKKTEIRGNVK